MKTSKKKHVYVLINKIHYTLELFKFKSLSMHLNKIHVYAVSFRQGNKQYGSNMTRPSLKSWIDGEVVVVCSARLFLTSDLMYCHFFLHNLKLIFKTFSVRTSLASPIVGAFQNASKFFVVLLCMIFIFIFKKQCFVLVFFAQLHWCRTVLLET